MSDLVVYRTKTFGRWMRGCGVTDALLTLAVAEMSQGLVDADLGGHVIKKRIPLSGRGKRSSARVVVATKFENRWFFLFGFKKSERSSIDSNELEALRALAGQFLSMSESQLEKLEITGELAKVQDGNTTKKQNS